MYLFNLKYLFKILISCFFFFWVFHLKAQNENHLQPFSDLLTVNPAFSGLNKYTSFHTGNQYYSLSKDQAYNLFYATYSGYSEKLNGGLGFTFKHGLMAKQQINTTEFGISYAGFEIRTPNGRIIPSVNTGILLATKQWFSYFMDMLFARKDVLPNPPGKKFTKYYIIKPGAGFLWDSESAIWGLSANFPIKHKLSDNFVEDVKNNSHFPVNLSFYFAKKRNSNRKGLKSIPFQTYPEIIILYNEDFILSRVSLNIQRTTKSFGLFLQNDFTNNMHCVGGTIGYRTNNIKINLNSGIGIPGISDNSGATCELSLNIIIPPVNYSKIKPWAPKRK